MNGTQDRQAAQGRWTVEDGAALKAWRVVQRKLQRDVGELLGVSGRTVSNWERGAVQPSREHLARLRALIGGDVVEAAGDPADLVQRAAEVSSEPAAQLDLMIRARLKRCPQCGSRAMIGLKWTAHQDMECQDCGFRVSKVEWDACCVEEEEAAPSARDPYTTRIDWRSFAYRGRDASGISLRAMVDAGLYAHMRDATRALRDSGLHFCAVQRKSSGGRPEEDCVLTLRDAQMFAARARTDVGQQILALIIDHHDEFQRLLDGDAEARARLAEVQLTATAPALTDDPILNALTIAIESRRAQLVLEQQVREQGARLELMESRVQRVRGESNLYQLAHRAGWMSTVSVERGDPKPHIVAVLAALRAAGYDSPARGVRQHMIPGEEGASVYAIGGEALEAWPELVEYYGDGRFAVVCPETGRTYRVTRIKREEA